MIKLSVVLAVHNEEKTLEPCLRSIQDIADEIVVVDGQSTDHTVEVAKRYGARVLSVPNVAMFHINKQKGLDAAKGEWILQLDADERVTPELRCDILEVVSGGQPRVEDPQKRKIFAMHQQQLGFPLSNEKPVAYFLPRANFFLGGYLKHGGVYPDGVIRLIKKGKAFLPCKSVHEQMQVNGPVGWLPNDLIHEADPTFSRYLQRTDRYTSLTAQEFLKKHISRSPLSLVWYCFLKPLQIFVLLFFRHKGVLDGFPGFVWALFSGLHYAIAYMKYEELVWKAEHTHD